MEDQRIAELKDEIEAQFLKQVLADRGLPFRIEKCADNYFGLYLGSGVVGGVHNDGQAMQPYGYVWGYVDDADGIRLALEQVRSSRPLDGPAKPRRYRIKKS